MDDAQTARTVLHYVGGVDNVIANTVCMTRLRVSVANLGLVDRDALCKLEGVLGCVGRGSNGIEVVFGPKAIQGVHQAFSRLTGIHSDDERLIGSARPTSNFQVQISPGVRRTQDVHEPASAVGPSPTTGAPEDPASPSHDTDNAPDNVILGHLASLLDDTARSDVEGAAITPTDRAARHHRLLVINGPNINMLGIREPDIYGREDFTALLDLCRNAAARAGFSACHCYQSNHEGDLVDTIQDAYQSFDAIVINPGAYTHTSIALLDALKAVGIPTVEVHISRLDEREGFRQVSYVRQACIDTVAGHGIDGYRIAIERLAAYLNDDQHA